MTVSAVEPPEAAPDVAAIIARVTDALPAVPGIVALVLGGSRATGMYTAASDIDIGLLYAADRFDVASLRQAVQLLDDAHRPDAVTGRGEWGPWVDGGGWLTMTGHPVDLIYRDVARVRASVTEAVAGQFAMQYHWGHPHGIPNTIYAAEVAQCLPLWDPDTIMPPLKADLLPYPARLRTAITTNQLAEAEFFLMVARHGLPRGDRSYTIGCAFRAIACLMQSLLAANEHWLLNEKGAVDLAARLPQTAPDLVNRVEAIYTTLGVGDLSDGLAMLADLVQQVRQVGQISASREE